MKVTRLVQYAILALLPVVSAAAQGTNPVSLDTPFPQARTLTGKCTTGDSLAFTITRFGTSAATALGTGATCASGTFQYALDPTLLLAVGDVVAVSDMPSGGGTATTAQAAVPAVYQGGELEHLMVGVNGVFGSSAPPAAKAFVDFYVENGLFGAGEYAKCRTVAFCLGSRLRAWGGFQLYGTTAAAQDFLVAESGTPPSLSAGGATNFNQVVEQAAAEGGLAIRISQHEHFLDAEPRGGPSRTVVELLSRIGLSSPLNPATPSPAVFCTSGCNPDGTAIVGQTPVYTVFDPPLRQRLFANWGLGFRLQTFFKNGTHFVTPSNFDFTVGQDEAVTGGHLHGAVFQLGGSIPVPGADALSIFFTAETQWPKSGTGFLPTPNNFVLISSPTATAGPGYTQVMQPLPGADVLRIGVAVDMIDFVKNHVKW